MMVLQGTETGRQVAHPASNILSVVNVLDPRQVWIAESRTAQLSKVCIHPVRKYWRLCDEDLTRLGRSVVTEFRCELNGEHFE
jgi:hypothetical protein